MCLKLCLVSIQLEDSPQNIHGEDGRIAVPFFICPSSAYLQIISSLRVFSFYVLSLLRNTP